jgi:hypothetical protein
MPITLNHSNIGVQYNTGSNYIIETVKSDLYLRNEIVDTIVRDNIQAAPVTPIVSIQEGSNIYAVESYTYSGTANTADFTRVFPNNTVCDILIVGGGGGGGTGHGGGGGGGSVIYLRDISLQGQYNISVGNGGAPFPTRAQNAYNGNDSYIVKNGANIYLAKGGGGGAFAAPSSVGSNGGSGGGGQGSSSTGLGGTAVSTNIPSGVYGFAGGKGNTSDTLFAGGGGGGSETVGSDSTIINTTTQINGGNGGNGKQISITGNILRYGGGGGGGVSNAGANNIAGTGGLGGGGNGGLRVNGISGSNGFGGGGGGGGQDSSGDRVGGNGGSGIVIIRYLLGTIPSTNFLTEPTVISPAAFTESIRTFTHSGGTEAQTTHTITVGQNTICDILIVGGGGGGGNGDGTSNEPGGGGAGGIVYMVNKTLSSGTYKINVGKGGASNTNGNNSTITDNNNNTLTFDSISLIGKGGGKGATSASQTGSDGGSGGGGGNNITNGGLATQGNTFWNGTSYVAGGFNGGKATAGSRGGGGGGAGELGDTDGAGNGGDGVQVSITGTSTFYAGGGNAYPNGSTTRSDGGGGTLNGGVSQQNGGNALLNTGSGGSGAYGGSGYSGGSGGSGIVIIKFKSLADPIPEGSPITHKRLNFAYDLTKNVEYQAQLKTGVGGWRIVRYLPPNLGRWYSGNNFTSTSVNSTNIGTAYNYTNEWGVPFGTFDEMFFGTFDMTYWLRCLKTSVQGTYANDLRPIISSSSSSTSYSARWYQRDSELHEPWVSINDYHAAQQLMLYVENSDTRSGDLRNAYGGMCVLVRDSTSGTTISNPNTYTLNFPVPTIADINNNSNIVLRGVYDISLSTINSSIIPKSNQYIPKPTSFTNYAVERMYPPVRNFTAATTTVSGQTYGNGTYVVSYSSFLVSYEPFKCFNTSDTIGGHWPEATYTDGNYAGSAFIVAGYLGEWLKIQLPVAIKLTRFRFLKRTGSQVLLDRSPKDFKVYGSNDNITWVELVNKTGAVYNASYIYEQTTPEITNTYTYYGLVVNKLFSGATVLNFDEWYIYGQEVLPSSLSVRYNILNPTLDPVGAQWTYNSSNTNVYHMGRVGIGTKSPEYQLDVRGFIHTSVGGYTQTGSENWIIQSDRRIKENIVKASYEKCLENVKNIELYNFNFKDNCVNTNDRHQLGFIAQEVQQVYPKAVEVGKIILDNNQGINDLLTLNTTQIKYTLYGAVKNLIERVENIESRVEQIYNMTLSSNFKSPSSNISISIINTSNMTANTSNITTNTSNVSVSTSNIAVNTSNIATNTSNIAVSTSNIAVSTSNIATNTSNVSVSTSNIAVSTSNIAVSTSNIAVSTSNIAVSTSNVSVSTSNIAVSTSNINTSNIDTSNIDTSNINTSNINTSNIDTSNIDTSNIDTSNIDTSNIDTSNIDTSNIDTSNIDTSNIDTSNV